MTEPGIRLQPTGWSNSVRSVMGRPARYTTDQILDAARDLVLEGGARAATVDGIVAAIGAPKGSIYHRFDTFEDLLGEMWLRAVRRSQERYLSALEADDPIEAAVAAALSLYDFAREEPGDARLIASLRREDVVGTVTDDRLRDALLTVNSGLGVTIRALARRLYGRATRPCIERVMFATVDLPVGAVRRHLITGSALPRTLRPQLEAAVRAALEPVD